MGILLNNSNICFRFVMSEKTGIRPGISGFRFKTGRNDDGLSHSIVRGGIGNGHAHMRIHAMCPF